MFMALVHQMLKFTPHAKRYRKKNATVHMVTMAIIDQTATLVKQRQSRLLMTKRR
jgi:hypothetical protein